MGGDSECCVICNNTSGNIFGAVNNNESDEFKDGFSLFCKLVNAASGRGREDVDRLAKLVDNFSSSICETCDLCGDALKEIQRLERVIEELKKSQMTHVNILKRLLLIQSTPKATTKRGQRVLRDNCSDKQSSSWKLIKSQLIKCLEQGQVAFPVANKRLGRPTRGTPKRKKWCGPASRRPTISPSPEAASPSISPYQSLVKPCVVKVIRVERQSEAMEADNWESNDIKQEIIENDDEMYEPDPAMDSDMESLSSHEPHEDDEVPSEKPLGKPTAMLAGRTFNRIYVLAENLYLFHCTIIKFSAEERLYTCQEPDCLQNIPGNLLDFSLQENIKSHVNSFHKSGNDSKVRLCLLCPEIISGSGLQFRMHLVAAHGDAKRKSLTMAICEICCKPCDTALILKHRWNHKNFQDKVNAIEAGESVPFIIKNKLKNKKSDPLYPFVFDEAGEDVTADKQKSRNLKEKLPRNYERIKSNEPFFLLNDDKLLYKFSLISLENKGTRMTCEEPGCSMSFEGHSMDFGNLFGNVKDHVDSCHYTDKDVGAADSLKICPLCKESLPDDVHWRHHLLTDHINKSWKAKQIICQICWMPILNFHTAAYRDHVWTHMNTKEQYRFCKDLLAKKNLDPRSRKKYTERAKRLAHGQDPHQQTCKICRKTFPSMKGLKAHLVIHEKAEKRKKWPCPECGKNYLSPQAMNVHVVKEHKPKAYQTCPVAGCGRTFLKSDAYKMKYHMQRHKEKNVYAEKEGHQCEQCGKSYSKAVSLRMHKRKVHPK